MGKTRSDDQVEPPQTMAELHNDLEFAIRQHIQKKLPETRDRVLEALERLDLKRKYKNGK